MKRLKWLSLFIFLFSSVLISCSNNRNKTFYNEEVEVKAEVETETEIEDGLKNESDVEEQKTNKTVPTKEPYTYNDFLGYYLHFASEERSHADMIVTIGNDYITIGWYLSEFELYNILNYSIKNNILTVEYSTIPHEDADEEYGTLILKAHEENIEKYIEFESGMKFYDASYEDILKHDYVIQDYLLEDIKK